MKVVHIVLSGYRDGFAYQENLLSQKHRELGFDVTVITSQLYVDENMQRQYGDVDTYVNKYGVKVIVLPCTTHVNALRLFINESKGLYKSIEDEHPDILFVHNFMYKDVRQVLRYARRHRQVPVYVDCHLDYYNTSYKTLYGRFKAIITGRRARCLVPVTRQFWGTTPWRVDFMRDVYRLPAEKVDFLLMGADENNIIHKNRHEVRTEVRERYGFPLDAFLLVTGGKLDRRKQQHLLLEAARRMVAENVYLLVFGTPSMEMKESFAMYAADKNIVQVGWVPSEDTYDLFLASDLAVFPGTHSVLWEEAVACSLPIMTRRWMGMEHINHCGNAVLLDEVTVETLVSNIRECMQPSRYSVLSKSAAEAAPSFFLRQVALRAVGMDESDLPVRG